MGSEPVSNQRDIFGTDQPSLDDLLSVHSPRHSEMGKVSPEKNKKFAEQLGSCARRRKIGLTSQRRRAAFVKMRIAAFLPSLVYGIVVMRYKRAGLLMADQSRKSCGLVVNVRVARFVQASIGPTSH